MSRTRIVATVGPATNTPEILRALAAAGMGIVRLNGSHADLDWHRAAIRMIREALPDVPIILDIPGRKIRTRRLLHEPDFEVGDEVVFTTDSSHDGRSKVPVTYDRLHEDVQAGQTIMVDDGTLMFKVVRISGPDIVCRAMTAGRISSAKGINVPHVKLNTALVTRRDEEMVSFARSTEVDYIGISFVESAEHVKAIRKLVAADGPLIVSKIETQKGIDHLDEIVDATDSIMIDRGDLSVETNLESLALMQKDIIIRARRAGKPVIVATEMLHTMITNSFPTKAEVSDITNAVLDGCAATMLSGETAVGQYPEEAVALMRRVANVAESYLQGGLDIESNSARSSIPRAIEDAVAMVCRNLPVTKVGAVTKSGYAARMLAAHMIRQPVLAVTNNQRAARSFNLLPGVEGIFVDIEFPRTSADHIIQCLRELWRRGKLTDDDLVLSTAVAYPRSGNRMNLLQTHYVRDLVETLRWSR